MTTPAPPFEGACRCGQVRMRVSAPPMLTMACHCEGCRRMTAGPFSLSVMVPAAGFEVIAGEPVIGGLHDPNLQHHHCPRCLSWLFTKVPAADFFVNVRATMFDVPAWSTPFMETCAAEKLDWVTTPAKHSFPGFPPMEAYEGLMTAFAGTRSGTV